MKKISLVVILSTILLFALLLCACNNKIETKGLEFTRIDNGNAYAVSKGGADATQIIIPRAYDNLPVTAIAADAFRNYTSMTEVIIPDSIVHIGDNAFRNCTGLSGVTVPGSVKTFGENVFRNCSGLTGMSLPFVGETLNGNAGAHLGYLFGSDDYENQGSSIPESLKEVRITGGDKIADYAFYGCGNLARVIFPDGIESIGAGAFMGCGKLRSITIPAGVEKIGERAFADCTFLIVYAEAESKPKDWKENWYGGYASGLGARIYWDIHNAGFAEIDGAQYVLEKENATLTRYVGDADTFTVPESVTIKGASKKVTAVGTAAFAVCDGLKGVTIGGSAATLADMAFYGCHDLSAVTISASVTTIGQGVFADCTGLTEIAIPASVTSIGSNLFYGCTDLSVTWHYNPALTGNNFLQYVTAVVIPSSVTGIGDRAFYGNNVLKSIVIPSSVTRIGSEAFSYCTGLASIVIPSSVTTISYYAFSGWGAGQMIFVQGFTGRPAGWESYWIANSAAQVIWNAGEKRTYNFVTNEGTAVASVTDYAVSVMPVTTREGWYFAGWYNNIGLTGSPVTFPYYRSDGTGTTLYAKWSSSPVTDGKTFETAHVLSLGSAQVNFTSSQAEIYYTFTPAATRSYTIYSTGITNDADPQVYLCNSSKNPIAYDDDGGSGWNFNLSSTLTAGQQYYYVVSCRGATATMTMTLA